MAVETRISKAQGVLVIKIGPVMYEAWESRVGQGGWHSGPTGRAKVSGPRQGGGGLNMWKLMDAR